jgi:hypothetical protein
MALPETIQVRRAEERAGYLAMTPVVTQTFRLSELIDLIVSVAGKDVRRVQHVLGAGTAMYHGYHYSWQGFAAESAELAALLAAFADDDPSRAFHPASATAALFEIAGGDLAAGSFAAQTVLPAHGVGGFAGADEGVSGAI